MAIVGTLERCHFWKLSTVVDFALVDSQPFLVAAFVVGFLKGILNN